MSAQDSILNQCGCCEGVKALTPSSLENRPGLSALVYRVGTQGSFKTSMQSALAGQAALRDLTTRSDDDPAIALIDGWATVLDVLSFYQERIANEGFLRTATERRSLLEMARSIGYELSPGVAASTYLAFTLETATGAPSEATIVIGTKAQSIPGQNELPQMFETVEEINAKAVWNGLSPRLTQPQSLSQGTTRLFLKGVSTQLQQGDSILFVDSERETNTGSTRWAFRLLQSVITDSEEDRTEVTWKEGLPLDLSSGTPVDQFVKVFALRQRAALFGHNAPNPNLFNTTDTNMDELIETGNGPYQWKEFSIQNNQIDMDIVYSKIVQGSWIVLSSSLSGALYNASSVTSLSRADFALSAKITRIDPDIDPDTATFGLRETTVYAQSEQLELAEEPITEAISGNSMVLDQEIEGFATGQLMIVSGTDTDGNTVSEVVILDYTELEDGFTKLVFFAELQNSYQRDSVTLNANVAQATHGETKTEVLGSGDGSQSFQKFVLKQMPLTYVSAATSSGAETTLEIRVNDLLWEEVPTLYGVSSDEHVYMTRLANDGKVTVEFGDGITGARLPTGVENVKATYRVGTGLDGMVDAEQVSLLMTRPLGVKAVVNPLAPTGAADPEIIDDARQNAPLTVLTLDRIVSLQDFEDFTRAFAGIGKAQATLLWNGERQMVHLTVAAADGSIVDTSAALYSNLVAAIDSARHPDQLVQVDTYEPLAFSLSARVLVDSSAIAEDVLANVSAALVGAFSFEERSFGQSVTESEVLAVMQGVSGVVAVDLDTLYITNQSAILNSRLIVHVARWQGDMIQLAQLLLIDSAGITLTEMTE